MQLPVCFLSVSVVLKKTPSLCFLARLHSFRYDVGKPALADHLQDVLTVELSVHQHVVDANEAPGRVEQIFDYLS